MSKPRKWQTSDNFPSIPAQTRLFYSLKSCPDSQPAWQKSPRRRSLRIVEEESHRNSAPPQFQGQPRTPAQGNRFSPLAQSQQPEDDIVSRSWPFSLAERPTSNKYPLQRRKILFRVGNIPKVRWQQRSNATGLDCHLTKQLRPFTPVL